MSVTRGGRNEEEKIGERGGVASSSSVRRVGHYRWQWKHHLGRERWAQIERGRERGGDTGDDAKMAQKSFSFAKAVKFSPESIHSHDVHNFPSPFSLTEFKQYLLSDVNGVCLLRLYTRFVALFSRSPSIFTTARRRWLRIPILAASPVSRLLETIASDGRDGSDCPAALRRQRPSPLSRAKCPSIYRCVSLSHLYLH